MGKPKCGQVLSVKVPGEDRGTDKFTVKSGVYAAVKKNLLNRFSLAFTAPSCSRQLFDDIGSLVSIKSVQQVPKGNYIFPEGTYPVTRLLLEEAETTYVNLSNEEVATDVTAEDFQYYCQRANERISFSYSGLHFGHYKADSFDGGLSALHAAKSSLCAQTGVALAR